METWKMDDGTSRIGKPSGLRRKASLNVTFCVKKEKSNVYRKIYAILQKSENDRTPEENSTLESSETIVKEVNSRLEKRRRLKSRSEEIEDQPTVLAEKCRILASALLNSQHLVVYSGAGVSTAARIPDYRGTNGIWTRLQQGKDIGCHDLSQAEPTLTHMALFALYRVGMLKHIVSQNCDGLHLRSGVPRSVMSEVHGNMYLEVCTLCNINYWRLFDVTEHTGRYSHETARLCLHCRKPLRDTIVHFGERGALRWPLNWKGACRNADKADIILCIGSSLKVLKRYPWLWCMDKPVKKRPLLFIVNLQWTPKDDQATLKINGKCDEVMSLVMSHLGMDVPKYIRHLDPIFEHATELHKVELHTTSQPILKQENWEKNEHADEDVKDKVLSGENSTGNSEFNDSFVVGNVVGEDIDLKLDVVEEEVVVTTTVNDSDSSAIKMELDDANLNCSKNDCDSSIVSIEDSKNDGCSKANLPSDSDSTNASYNNLQKRSEVGHLKSVVLRDASGISVPLAEFDQLYSKIGKELARRNSNEFFLEFCKPDDPRKSIAVVSNVEGNNRVVDFTCQSQKNSTKNTQVASNNCINSSLCKGETTSISDKSIKMDSIDYYNYSNKICDNNINSGRCSKNSIISHNSSIFTYPKICNDSFYSSQQTVPLDLSSIKSSQVIATVKNVNKSDKSSSSDDSDSVDDKNSSPCRFCSHNYGDNLCQFYKKLIPVIPDVGPFCYCCDDDDTDNDSPTDKDKEKESKDQTSDSKNKSDPSSTVNKVPIVNPGWFGKGYRKRTKKKR